MKKKLLQIKAFDVINISIMCFICFIMIYPFYFVFINSINDGYDAMKGGIYWWPRVFSINNYIAVFHNSGLARAFLVTIARTFIATTLHIFFSAMVAFGLCKQGLIGKKIYMMLGIITLFFNGGLIPTFLLINSLGLYNKFIVYIIPTMLNFINVIIFMNFFKQLPIALEESAVVDGASDFRIFTRIILPLSKPVLATIVLFVGVYHWNDYFMGVVYVSDDALRPIQTFFYKIVAENATQALQHQSMGAFGKKITSQSIKYATMIIATLPIICVYPFLQKYFVKGMLIGSIKS
ncbi:carbohydrate ABC transporter permease [Vallitalea pronyensis]|nr:carbohydrate ABC transporter permease [Vallitalea pronyensis]